ncbi:MAG: hypothetical protein ACI9J2_001385 [Saprospiraceae bacterium]|jgi:hypothetical protein
MASTAEWKHWLAEDGWQTVIDYLNSVGLQPVVIQKEPCSLNNVIDKSGDIPIVVRIDDLLKCEFMIGLGSG